MLLIKPYLGCNLHCLYCYERKYRKKKPPKMDYDLDAVLKRMEELKDSIPQMALHGGEPLMMGTETVRKILSKMKELTGKSAIQTNGVLIDDKYIKIFKECNTSVGISFDGPEELSDFRPGTRNLHKTVERLQKEGLRTSMIIVVSKANAGTPTRLEKLKKYLLELNEMKICGRLNPCGGAPGYDLESKRSKEVYLDLADFCLHHNLRWSPFIDIINGLQGKPRVCTFMGCDPFSTPSATVIVGDGSITNCMRTNEKGILLRHPVKYNTRDEILTETSQEFGGCKGCRYWTACHGGCPTMAINNDWRNRTNLCFTWKALFQFYEKVLNSCDVTLALSSTEELQKHCVKPGVEHVDHLDSSHNDSQPIQPRPEQRDHQDTSHHDWPDHQDHVDSSHFDGLSKKERPQSGSHIDHIDMAHSDTPQPIQPQSLEKKHLDSPHHDWPDHQDSFSP